MTISFSTFKKLIIYIWLIVVLALIAYFIFHPEVLTQENLVRFFAHFEGYILLAYIVVCVISGFFLVPNTPFIIAGALLFPESPLLVMGISLFNAVFGASFLYYFAEWMGLAETLSEKYPERMDKIKEALNKPYSILLVVLWSFLPIVPTDLVAYMARVVGMRYTWMILGIILGELPLIVITVLSTCYFVQN